MNTSEYIENVAVVEQDQKQTIEIDLDDARIYQEAKKCAGHFGTSDGKTVDAFNREIATHVVMQSVRKHDGDNPEIETTTVVESEIPLNL